MKQVDCDIIKDLLPNYIDKLTNESTNKFIEEHLKTCKQCKSMLENVNADISTELLNNQNEQIDYLKGYRKNKIFSVIIAVLITILVIFDIFIIGSKFLLNNNFYMNVTDVEICYKGESERNGNKTLCYEMTSDVRFLQPFCWDYDVVKDIENKAIYMKVVGLFKLHRNKSRSLCEAELDDDTECVYLIDKKGNKIKIWDKEQGVLTETSVRLNI